MDWVYWLISLAVALCIYVYARSWHKRPSDLEPATIISYAHQTLAIIINFHLSEEDEPISYPEIIEPYLKEQRDLDWRQRRDVINYMMRANWLYRLPNSSSYSYARYMLTAEGRSELESAGAVKQSAQGEYPYLSVDARGARNLIFSNVGNNGVNISGDARQEIGHQQLAARLANALRIDARSASSSDDRSKANDLADQIDHAVTKQDGARIDKLIGRVRDLLQIANYSFPLAHEVIQLIFR
jgi:hypothetical protein